MSRRRSYPSRRQEHLPSRPTWRCRACGCAWPCSAAKLRLLGRYREDRAGLLIHLTALHEEAAAELGDVISAVVLLDRFVSWARVRG
ncbi:flavin reductase [Micromonospora sp. NPDC048871]|uniref:flavin reductase n=1 Tax=Micromonospora sp. NPDC048871 TaxID=3364259 RepID=UPI00371100E4